MNDDLRAKFEAWAKANGYRTDYAEAGAITMAGYKTSSTAHAFEGFQAAASLYAKDAERLREALRRISLRCPTDATEYTVASVGDIARAALEGEPK